MKENFSIIISTDQFSSFYSQKNTSDTANTKNKATFNFLKKSTWSKISNRVQGVQKFKNGSNKSNSKKAKETSNQDSRKPPNKVIKKI